MQRDGARMALLDRLLPAWRHSDPEVRATAVRELETDAQDVLASVAQRDDDVIRFWEHDLGALRDFLEAAV